MSQQIDDYKMKSTQTSVEWLEEKLKENLKHIIINNDYVLMESYFLQAKQMENQKIADAQMDMFHEIINNLWGKDYLDKRIGAEEFVKKYKNK